MHWIYPTIAMAIGLVIGSFLNVVIHRGPKLWNLIDDDKRKGNLAVPGSYCPACGTPIEKHHLVPVLSYLALRGKCAVCRSPIPQRYPAVEVLGGLAALSAYLLFGVSVTALLAAAFFWFLIALAAIDLETGFLPDALTLPLLIIGLGANAATLFTTLSNALIGAVAGYVVFRLIGEAFFRLRKLEGLGQGDAKLLAAIGAWLGWQALAPTVLIAALTALVGLLIVKLTGKAVTNETPIPFGPTLAMAGAVLLIGRTISL